MKKKRSVPKRPAWAQALASRVARGPALTPARQARALRLGLRILENARLPERPGLSLPEQPLDRHLLALSPLYRRSREVYLESGGAFRPTLVSSPRTLSSPILLEPLIEYSPIERELFWVASDPAQAKDQKHLLRLRTYASSLFHEQSHRILWHELPPPPTDGPGLRRYLNFVESLVIVLDMALGDGLGPELASIFYLSGVVYDPGTSARVGLSRREYRNYLQAALHATYLNLELYDPAAIPDGIAALFPMLPADLLDRAAARALRLDRGFVTRTNPVWQKRHRITVLRQLARLSGRPWELPSDPLDNREQYLFAENWLESFGL